MTTTRRTAEMAARAAIAARTEELFRSSGALREGHFELKSGRHSDRYLEKFLVLQDTAATSELCAFWAAEYGGSDGRPATVDLAAGPTMGGVILAFETGRQLGIRAIFAEEVRDASGQVRRAFRRGFRIEPGERVLLVDDILTTGGSLLAMLPVVEEAGGEVIGCHVLVDRSGGLQTLVSPLTGRSYPLRALWRLELPTWDAGSGSCPGCADGTPLVAPGSTGTGVGAGTGAGPGGVEAGGVGAGGAGAPG